MFSSALKPTRREVFIALSLFFISYLGQSFFQNGRHRSSAGVPTVPTADFAITFNRSNSVPNYWDSNSMPETILLRHPYPGFTIMDNVYAYNGALFIVTDSETSFPDKRLMISAGRPGSSDPNDLLKNEPGDDTLRFISRSEAYKLFGSSTGRMDGVTLIQNDPTQLLGQMYHHYIEMFALGLWRLYSSLDPSIPSNGATELPPPHRLFFPHAERGEWQNRAGMFMWCMRAAFPSLPIETQEDWVERHSYKGVLLFDRIVLGDREAWLRGDTAEQRDPAAPSYPLALSPAWWEPVRKNVVTAAAMSMKLLTTSQLGNQEDPLPVITYISRQRTSRRLTKEADMWLIKALRQLGNKYGYEVNVVTLEDMDHAQQVYLASRTTILIGVHGDGLTAQLWMKPTRRSTVIEIFHPRQFIPDYEYTARSMGHKYYAVWDSRLFTSPKLPSISSGDGLHEDSIPVNGEAVARLIHRRLSLNNPERA